MENDLCNCACLDEIDDVGVAEWRGKILWK